MNRSRSLALLAAATLSLVACASPDSSRDDSAGTDDQALSAKRKGFRKRLQDFLLRKQTDVVGLLTANQTTGPDGTITSEVSASFSTKYRGPDACTTEKFGDYCEVQICPPVLPDTGFQSEPVNVGKVRLQDARQHVELLPGADNKYEPKKFEGALWNPGDMLTWTLSGDPPRVPHAGLRQQAPIPITITGELADEVDRTKDYSVSWTSSQPANGAQVGVFIFAFKPPVGINPAIALCNVPVETGHLSIPAAALAKLPPGLSGLAVQEQTISHVIRARQDYIFQMFGGETFKDVTVK